MKELNTISCVFIDSPTTGGKRPAVKIGAAVTLSAMEEYFNKLIVKVRIILTAVNDVRQKYSKQSSYIMKN